MRTRTRIIIQKDGPGVIVFCNDPNAEVIFLDGSIKMEECGSCGEFHRPIYGGDCRNDDERFIEVS